MKRNFKVKAFIRNIFILIIAVTLLAVFMGCESSSSQYDTAVDKNGNTTTFTTDKEISDILKSIYAVNQSSTDNSQSSSNQSSAGKDLCSYCGGIGYCSHCGYGECGNCFGEGEIDCSSCIFGDCSSCAGDGGSYKYVYGDVEWKSCSRCSGSGFCRSCDGLGSKLCSYCRGTGNCNYCNGSGNCQYCAGTGKK